LDLAPLDVNRKSPIQAGRRLSRALELRTKKRNSDEGKEVRSLGLCCKTHRQHRAKSKLEKDRAESLWSFDKLSIFFLMVEEKEPTAVFKDRP